MKKHPFLTGFFVIFIIAVIFLVGLISFSRMGMLQQLMHGDNAVAVVELEGVITKSRDVIAKLHRYQSDAGIKAVVIRIDSPGGAVGPSQEIFEEVIKLREKKPVIASMGSVAASGGYYVACAAHSIFANPGTITGSIGVIIESANVEDLLGKIGMKSVVIKSGKYKDILSPTRQMQMEERSLVQDVVDSIHGQFIDAVALGRDLPREKVAAIADGRIFSGEQAKNLMLVDELGNLQDAIDRAAEQAGIEGEPNVVYPRKKRPSLMDFLIAESVQNIMGAVRRMPIKIMYVMESL